MYYFAYGSNMSTVRLAQRVPAPRAVGAAALAGHRWALDLIGGDGSGKCNIHVSGDDAAVHGVLFELDVRHLDRLHAAEGPAYEFIEAPVDVAGECLTAAVYRGLPGWLDAALAPFDWYMAYVRAGAREHGLPEAVVRRLDAIETVADDNVERARANWAAIPSSGS